MKRVILIVVGCGLTWTAAAVGIALAVQLHVFRADVADAQVAPPALAPVPAAETIAAKQEPIAEPIATPPDEVELSCGDPRFRAIRRAVRRYCRAPHSHDGSADVCPNLTKQLGSCRTASPLRLTHPGGCHPEGLYGVPRTRTICHDYLASPPSVDDTANYIGLTRTAGRWKVVRLEYDDLERP